LKLELGSILCFVRKMTNKHKHTNKHKRTNKTNKHKQTNVNINKQIVHDKPIESQLNLLDQIRKFRPPTTIFEIDR